MSKLLFNKFTTQMTIMFALTAFMATSAFAQTDPNDPSSPNYRGKNKVYTRKFTGAAGAAFGRGLDQYDEAFGSYSFSGNYALNRSSITVNLGYKNPLDGDTDNRRDAGQGWMFEDVGIVWNAPLMNPIVISGQSISLAPRLSYRAPVSFASRDAGSYGSVTGALIGSTSVDRFTFILSPRATVSYHDYETRDVAGFVKNRPFGLTLVSSIRALVIKNLYLSGTGFLYNAWDYNFGAQAATGLSSNVYYQASKNIGLTAYITWSDLTRSNNVLFDDDRSEMGLGLISTF